MSMSRWFVMVMLGLWGTLSAEALKIVVSIPPLAAITRAIAGDKAEIELLVDQSISPHIYALKPSDLRKMNQADIILWIGPAYESFLEKPLKNCSTKVVGLLDIPTLKVHRLRISQNSNDKSCHHGCDHDHDTLKRDGHVWLDPDNGIALAQEIATQLSNLDHGSAEFYLKRFEKFKQSVEELKSNLQTLLNPDQAKGFLVFHDGYQYFERAFGLKEGHVMSLLPDVSPSIKRMTEIRKLIQDKNILVLFAETQFSPRLMQVLAEETHLKIGLLDPLGSADNTYEGLLRNLALSFSNGFKSATQGTQS